MLSVDADFHHFPLFAGRQNVEKAEFCGFLFRESIINMLYLKVVSVFVVLLGLKGTEGTLDCTKYGTFQDCSLNGMFQGQKCLWSQEKHSCVNYANIPSTSREEPKQDKGMYNPLLAYNYTLLCALAYSKDPKKCLSKLLPESDLVLYQGIKCNCKYLFFFGEEICFAYTAVSQKSKTIFVAFKGTEFPENSKTRQLLDQILSTLFIPKQLFITGGRVQEYFKNAHDLLSPNVETSIRNLTGKYKDYNVTITGHSLGGALASLSAASLVYKKIVNDDKLSVYLFGEPRVGNGDYAKNYDRLVKNSWRVVHNRDVVSHLPICSIFHGCSATDGGPFHTKTEVFYPDIAMNVTSPYKICATNEDYTCSNGLLFKNWCTTDIETCIQYHKHYFGIPVGTICDHPTTNYQQPRSDQLRSGFDLGQGRVKAGQCEVVNF